MHAYVYKSRRKADTYVYLRERDAFGVIPEPMRAPLGELDFVLDVLLTPERKLAQADPAVVRANLAAHGFHIQFPPNDPAASSPVIETARDMAALAPRSNDDAATMADASLRQDSAHGDA